MKTITTLLAASILSTLAYAGEPTCTQEPKDKWMKEDAFQTARKAEGLEIKKFKVTKSNCYEIYGKNKEGKKVEIYYNPVTGAVVKENIR